MISAFGVEHTEEIEKFGLTAIGGAATRLGGKLKSAGQGISAGRASANAGKGLMMKPGGMGAAKALGHIGQQGANKIKGLSTTKKVGAAVGTGGLIGGAALMGNGHKNY